MSGRKMKRVLVTGASGGLGQHMLRYLARQKNLEVKALVHRSPVTLANCTTVSGNLLDLASLVQATRGIDVVAHLAALTHSNCSEDYFRVNVEGTKNLLDACTINGIKRFIHISSRAVHPQGGSYSESKLRGEELVRKSGLEWVVVRPAEVFGPDSPDAVNKVIRWIQSFPVVPVIGNGTYLLSPAYIDDVVAAIGECIINSGHDGKILLLSGPEEVTYTELIDRICRFLCVKRVKIFIPVAIVRWMVEISILLGGKMLVRDQIPRLVCDKSTSTEPLFQPTNYHPRSLEQGLSQFLRQK